MYAVHIATDATNKLTRDAAHPLAFGWDARWFRNESVERADGTTVACPMLLETRLASSTLSSGAPPPGAAATATATVGATTGADTARGNVVLNGATSRVTCSAAVATGDAGKAGGVERDTREGDAGGISWGSLSRSPSPLTPLSSTRDHPWSSSVSEEEEEEWEEEGLASEASVRDMGGIVGGATCCNAAAKTVPVAACSGCRLEDGGAGVDGNGGWSRGCGGAATGGGDGQAGTKVEAREDERRGAIEQRQKRRAMLRLEVDRLDGERRRKNKCLVTAAGDSVASYITTRLRRVVFSTTN